jgi:hypothetical protein
MTKLGVNGPKASEDVPSTSKSVSMCISYMLKDIVDENICRKGIEKEAIANLFINKKTFSKQIFILYMP